MNTAKRQRQSLNDKSMTFALSAHTPWVQFSIVLVHVGSQAEGLGTPSRFLARTISWNACKLLLYFHYHSMTSQRCLLVGILRSTLICIAKLISGKEEVQEAVHLALPSVAIEEDADPSHNTLEEEDGERPHKCQADCFQVGDAASVFLGTTTMTNSTILNSQSRRQSQRPD